tara:strand:+ start:424 stop:528 length:105 start_codon:yes stop_codon:yes gene_type:complete
VESDKIENIPFYLKKSKEEKERDELLQEKINKIE